MQHLVQISKMKHCTEMTIAELKAKAESLPCVRATKSDIATIKQFHKDKAAGKVFPLEKVMDELGMPLTKSERAKLAYWEKSRKVLGVNVRRRAK